MLKICSVDWFQYHCVSPMLTNTIIGSVLGDFTICKTKVIIPNYRDCYEVRHHDNVVLFYVGRFSSVPSADVNSVSIKVDNALLYTSMWCPLLHRFIKETFTTIRNITRLDLCCDFNEFCNGINPADFIKYYVYGGKLNPIRKGSNVFNIIGNKGIDAVDLQTIRFGSASSAVKVYMYNKTKELEEVKDKPYIRELWECAGLDVSNVWRVEISISSAGTYLKRVQEEVKDDFFHNEIITIDAWRFLRLRGDMLKTEAEIYNLFATYADEYFHFVNNSGQKYTKDMHPITLFDFDNSVKLYKPTTLKTYIKVGRTEKVCANKLFEICEKYNDLTTDERVTLYNAGKVLVKIGALKDGCGRSLEDMFISELKTSESALSMWQSIKTQFGCNMRDLKLLLHVLNNIQHHEF